MDCINRIHPTLIHTFYNEYQKLNISQGGKAAEKRDSIIHPDERHWKFYEIDGIYVYSNGLV
jgi:hypothetical protein